MLPISKNTNRFFSLFLLLFICLTSCDHLKDNLKYEDTESLNGETVEQQAFVDDVWRIHTITGFSWMPGKFTDTSAYVKNNTGLNIIGGNSFFENWITNGSSYRDSMAVPGINMLSRGIGGTTYSNNGTNGYLRFIDSCLTKYPNIKSFTLGGAENYWLKDIYTNNGANAVHSGTSQGIFHTIIKPEWEAAVALMEAKRPTIGYIFMLTPLSPKLKAWGYEADVQAANDYIVNFVNYKRTSPNPNKWLVLDVAKIMDDAAYTTQCSFCNPMWTYVYKPDSIHPNENTYRKLFVASFKAAFAASSGTVPPVDPDTSFIPEPLINVKAGLASLGTYIGLNFFDTLKVSQPWNWRVQATQSTPVSPATYLTAFRWVQISGPSTVTWLDNTTLQPRDSNAPTLKFSGAVAGFYVFRVQVTDNLGRVEYGYAHIRMVN
jgi:hypothetical protein